jgi:cytosine/adenosine deaminase-related metal-dependent hydrolase
MSDATTILLRGGTVVTFTNGGSKEDATILDADVLVKHGKIAEIAKNIQVGADMDVVDCTGKWVAPGFIDTHR